MEENMRRKESWVNNANKKTYGQNFWKKMKKKREEKMEQCGKKRKQGKALIPNSNFCKAWWTQKISLPIQRGSDEGLWAIQIFNFGAQFVENSEVEEMENESKNHMTSINCFCPMLAAEAARNWMLQRPFARWNDETRVLHQP